ncbi:DNA-processing protein DprA [Campylobacter sp. faydin G-24]|uniref:DNA-processing protein DprA n=1 Tax=Campylobacter anatolicus TaxID=2829105 RepID=A0ABS5HKR6_9BACT|nr:DNA-processing protein DprA [Campylobacter anatolicus]MBR8465014.1 DNA-processing protein DprA [Campylobacter anatolicus]
MAKHLKNIIPKENNELAKDIVLNGGLLISEYYQDARSKQEQIARFIKRDRLQAMFSDMVVLSASYSKEDTLMNKKLDSGSRHAMQKAKEYEIKRAVMYDRNLSYTQEFNLNTEIIE